MVGIATKKKSFSVLGSPADELSLRIHGTAYDGQIVRLRSQKCTVGSGKRCTLRLRAHGIGPLHCLILRGVAGTVVRSWSPNTRLNGSSFEDARLSTGDRLSFGPIELEVLSEPKLGPDPNTPAQAFWPNFAAPAPAQKAEPSGRLELANASARRRARRLIEEVRKLRHRLDRSNSSAGQQQQNEQSLIQRWEQLTIEREQLARERQQLETSRLEQQLARQAADAQLADLTRQYAVQAEQLASRERQLDQRQAEINSERLAQQSGLSEQAEQHAARLSELDGERRHLVAQREQLELDRQNFELQRSGWEASHQAVSGEHAEQLGQLELREAELVVHQQLLATERQQYQSAVEQLDRQKELWEAVQLEAKAQLDLQTQDCDRQLAALQSDRNTLAAERQAWNAEIEAERRMLDSRQLELQAVQSACEATSARLAERQAELSIEQESLERQRAAWQLEQANAAAEWSAKAAQLETERVALEAQQAAFHEAQAAASAAAEQETADESAATLGNIHNQALAERLANWHAEKEQAEARFARRSSELDCRQAKLAQQQQQLTEEQGELAAQLAELSNLERQQAGLQMAEAAFKAERRQWELQQAEAQARWDDRERKLEEYQNALEAEHQSLERQRAEIEHLQGADGLVVGPDHSQMAAELAEPIDCAPTLDAAEETAADAPADGKVESSVDEDALYERLRRLSILKEIPNHEEHACENVPAANLLHANEEAAEHAESEVASTIEPPSDARPEPIPAMHTAKAGSTAPAGEGEESIEDYMARLLNRMRGGVDAPAAPRTSAPQPASDPKPVVEPAAANDAKEPESEPAQEQTGQEEPGKPEPKVEVVLTEMVRRTAPPEVSDMAAMRELANLQARAAIKTHSRQSSIRSALGKWSVAALALGSSTAALLFAKEDDLVTRVGAMLGLCVTLYWSYQAAVSTFEYFKGHASPAPEQVQPVTEEAAV